VLGDNLDPDVVSRALASFPDQSWHLGDQKRYRDDAGNEHFHDSFHEWGGWKRFIPENLSCAPLEEQLAFWLENLESRAGMVADLLDRGWSITLDCHFSTGTTELIELPAQLQKRLGTLGIDVDIHFFVADTSAEITQ
jgi:hypothetical protein